MKEPPKPSLTPSEKERARREAKLAEALRANLRRRKQANAPADDSDG